MTWCHVRSEMSKVYRVKEGQEGGAEARERRGESTWSSPASSAWPAIAAI